MTDRNLKDVEPLARPFGLRALDLMAMAALFTAAPTQLTANDVARELHETNAAAMGVRLADLAREGWVDQQRRYGSTPIYGLTEGGFSVVLRTAERRT